MRMPARTASIVVRLGFGRYLGRRLRRARLADEELEVKRAGLALSEAAAALNEAELVVSDALADRDAADDDLDDLCKRHRQTIEGRVVNAIKLKPYTDLYPDGVAWYVKAPLNEQVSRYELLARRYEGFLPEGDPVRAEAPRVRELIAQWSASRAEVDRAELDVAMARAKVQQATATWEETVTRLYFRLAEKLGKAGAERLFPRPARARRPGDVEVGDEDEAPPADAPVS